MVEQPAAAFILASLLPELLVVALVAGLGLLLALAVRATMRHWAESAASPTSANDIARLEALVAEARSLIDELDRKAVRVEDLLQRAGQSEPQGSQPAASAPTRAAASPVNQRSIAPDHAAASEGDPATKRIYSLADEGLDAVQIAQRLGEQVGKVQLILALRRR